MTHLLVRRSLLSLADIRADEERIAGRLHRTRRWLRRRP